MAQHHINALRRIHGTLKAINEKVGEIEGGLKPASVDLLSTAFYHVDQLLSLYERAETSGGSGSDLFNFGFDGFESAFDLQAVLNQDWGNKQRVESTVRDMLSKMQRDGSLYLRLLEHKRKVADAWGDPKMLSADLIFKQAKAAEILADLEKQRGQLQAIFSDVSRLRTASAQSDHFGKLACQYCREASGWLWAMGVLAVFILALGAYEMFGDHSDIEGSQKIYHVIAGRVILVSLGFYAMRVFAQGYRQSKHNKIVNLHRSRALLAFEGIIGAVDDREAKGVVLGKAADALFSHQNSVGDRGLSKDGASTDVRISLTGEKVGPSS